jgi:hypothetical protein
MWSDPVRYTNDQKSPTKRNTLALVPTAAALEALAQPSLQDQEAMQLVHDMWCHPGNDEMEQIYKARQGRGFPRGFITQLRKFHCATCAVSKRTQRYQRSKRFKVAAAKRATQAKDVESTEPKQVYSGKLGFVSERTIKDIIIIARCEHANHALMQISMTPKRISRVGSAQGLASHTDVPALLIISSRQQSRQDVCSSALKPPMLYI